MTHLPWVSKQPIYLRYEKNLLSQSQLLCKSRMAPIWSWVYYLLSVKHQNFCLTCCSVANQRHFRWGKKRRGDYQITLFAILYLSQICISSDPSISVFNLFPNIIAKSNNQVNKTTQIITSPRVLSKQISCRLIIFLFFKNNNLKLLLLYYPVLWKFQNLQRG